MWNTILGVLFGLAVATTAGAAHRPQVPLKDLELLADSSLSDRTILVFLETREIGFQLDAETIARLRQRGVSEEVIRYLLQKTGVSDDPDDRVAYVWSSPYPLRYYDLHYGYGADSYFGDPILGHWTHGYHWLGHHLVAGHHFGDFVGHSYSHGSLHGSTHSSLHSSSRHSLLSSSHTSPHYDGGHLTSSHQGTHLVSHLGTGRSGHGSGRGHGRSGRGGGHSRGHSAGHSRGHGGGHGGGH